MHIFNGISCFYRCQMRCMEQFIYFSNNLFCFKTSPQLVRRMPQQRFAGKIKKCFVAYNFTRLSISMGLIRPWLYFHFWVYLSFIYPEVDLKSLSTYLFPWCDWYSPDAVHIGRVSIGEARRGEVTAAVLQTVPTSCSQKHTHALCPSCEHDALPISLCLKTPKPLTQAISSEVNPMKPHCRDRCWNYNIECELKGISFMFKGTSADNIPPQPNASPLPSPPFPPPATPDDDHTKE